MNCQIPNAIETIFGKRPFEKEVIEEKVKTTTKTPKKTIPQGILISTQSDNVL